MHTKGNRFPFSASRCIYSFSFGFFNHYLASWLLKLCAQAAADATASNEPENTTATTTTTTTTTTPTPTTTKMTKMLSFGCESVIRVGRNVSFEQAVDILERAGRAPDRNYAHELFKVFLQNTARSFRRQTILTRVSRRYTGWLKIKYPTGEYAVSPQPVV